jgi:hypothetical protein
VGHAAPAAPRLAALVRGPARRQAERLVHPLLEALLEGRPAVLGLLAEDPFAGEWPRQVRAELDDYRFTDRRTRRETGRWWSRRRIGVHHPAVGLRREVS